MDLWFFVAKVGSRAAQSVQLFPLSEVKWLWQIGKAVFVRPFILLQGESFGWVVQGGTGAAAVKVWFRELAFCHSLKCKLHLWKLSFIISTTLRNTKAGIILLQTASDNSMQLFSDTFTGFDKCFISSILDPTVFPHPASLKLDIWDISKTLDCHFQRLGREICRHEIGRYCKWKQVYVGVNISQLAHWASHPRHLYGSFRRRWISIFESVFFVKLEKEQSHLMF